MLTATKSRLCPACGETIHVGDEIRFETITVMRHRSISGLPYETTKRVPRHAGQCELESQRRMYLRSVDEKEAALRETRRGMLAVADKVLAEKGIRRHEQIEEYLAPRFAALEQERKRINENGHPY